jgi:hypothetical protein
MITTGKKFCLGYDSITLKLPIVDAGDFVANNDAQWHIVQRTGEFKGCWYHHNLKISVTSNFVTIENSISRYLNGNNLHPLTPSEMKKAIRRLNGELSLDLFKAKITRVDFAGNIELTGTYVCFDDDTDATGRVAAVSEYLDTMGAMPRFDKKTFGNGTSISYDLSRSDEEFMLYDKTLQMNQRFPKVLRYDPGYVLPDEVGRMNIIRLELRYKLGKVSKKRGAVVTVKELCGDEFYSWLCDKWRDKYESIEKRQNLLRLNYVVRNCKEFKSALMAVSATYFGTAYLNRIIDSSLKGAGARSAKDLLKALKRKGYTTTGTLIDELNIKVKNLYEYSVESNTQKRRNGS